MKVLATAVRSSGDSVSDLGCSPMLVDTAPAEAASQSLSWTAYDKPTTAPVLKRSASGASASRAAADVTDAAAAAVVPAMDGTDGCVDFSGESPPLVDHPAAADGEYVSEAETGMEAEQTEVPAASNGCCVQ